MKTFIDILKEAIHMSQIPLTLRKSSDGPIIFCPACGVKFTYYKEGNLCRSCGKEIFPRQVDLTTTTENPCPVFQKGKVMLDY